MSEIVENYRTVSLKELAGGIVEELFQNELNKTLDNVADPNVPWKPVRKITVELLISPTEDREQAAVNVQVTSKLPGVRPYSSTFFLARRGKDVKAYEHNLKQGRMDFDEQKRPIVRLPYKQEE